ncbi:MAG TPA: hypothetical protein VG710_09935 [Opitutus sp.]|nr:hypothetical protein [Opitutus sp.]
MKFRTLVIYLSVLGLASAAPAAESDVQELKNQLAQLQAAFEKTRHEQQQQIEALTRKIEALTAAAPASNPAPASAAGDEQKKLEQELAAETAAAPASPAAAAAASPPPPAPAARAGSAYMNLSYGASAVAGWSSAPDPSAQLELGDHDPVKRGVSLRNAEIAVDGAVDPYFKGFANIVLKLDKNNETSIELEESFLESTSLPANLQLKAGQYFAAFGRENVQHPHMWSFVDQPLILGRAFGPDGLRSLGAQVSWLAPTPFYTEAFLSVLDGQGGTAFSFRNPGEPDPTGVERYAGRATIDRPLRGPQDLVFVPRIASSFELSDTQTLLAGVSGAFGPNDTGPHARTEIYGADLFWKWKPADASQGFPYVTWQTEALYRRFDAGADPLAPAPLPAETLRDSGFYSQLVWGFIPRWNAGLRADYVSGNDASFDASDPFRGERYRFSPELTFFPSEFSKIRLQYNFDHGAAFGSAGSIWLQVEFGLGAHAAHKY